MFEERRVQESEDLDYVLEWAFSAPRSEHDLVSLRTLHVRLSLKSSTLLLHPSRPLLHPHLNFHVQVFEILTKCVYDPASLEY